MSVPGDRWVAGAEPPNLGQPAPGKQVIINDLLYEMRDVRYDGVGNAQITFFLVVTRNDPSMERR